MNTVNLIAFLFFMALFLFVLFFGAVAYELGKKNNALNKEGENEWIFSDFSERLYEIIFGDANEDEVATSLGLNVEKYYRNCELTKTKPDVHGLIIDFIYSIILFVISVFMALFGGFIFIILGLLAFFFLIYYKQVRMSKKAERMRFLIVEDIPRFLDLLQSELAAGLPAESAIYILSGKMTGSLLSREFMEAFNTMGLGAEDWTKAITKTAEKYDVDILSDFVMNIVTAYERGVSITDTVVRLNKDIKQTYILNMKERSDKMTNTILLPITVFQFIPMIVFIMVPALVQVFTSLR